MLKKLDFNRSYSTKNTDIGSVFYTPALLQSIRYDRISGYFSSAALANFAKGIEGLLRNQGKYRLIISNEISEYDYGQIKSGYQNRDFDYLLYSKVWKDDDDLSAFKLRHLANLAYLIEIGLVDIKVGFTTTGGLFHAKYGIFSDNENNQVMFNGSLNETDAAFKSNFEEILIVSSWESRKDRQAIIEKQKEFDEYWNGENRDGMIFVKEINEIAKLEILKYSKGRIIMEAELLKSNSLIFYIDNGQFYMQDNLENQEVDQSQRAIKKIKKDYLNGELWEFKKNLSYVDAEKILSLLERFKSRTDIEVIIASSVYDFIEASKFEIDEISKRGSLIKVQDEDFKEQYEKFSNIVNEEVSRKLRQIQSWVSFYMATMRRVANFSVPGAGKTAMMYGTFAYLSSPEIDKVDKMVVIGPKNSFLAWKDEFELVFGKKRKLRVLDIHADNFSTDMFYKNFNQYNLILINYEALNRYEKILKNRIDRRTMLVFDEVHKVKGIGKVRAESAIAISQGAKYRYVLTGTPIPNSYLDIWNFLHILYNQEYKSYFGMSQAELKNPDFIEIEDINEKLNPFFWRVTKSDLGVPEANPDYLISTIANDDEQAIVNLLWLKYGKSPFKLFIRLQQLATNPELLKHNISREMFFGNEEAEDDDGYNSDMDDQGITDSKNLELINRLSTTGKFETCIQKVNDLVAEGKVCIIWCIFISTIEKVRKRLEVRGHRVAVIYGSVPAVEREQIIKRFQNKEYDVLITNPHTLAESVSLHHVAHDALYLEYSFNLTHMLQSRDRIHRLGLKDGVQTNYYYFLMEGQDDSDSCYGLQNRDYIDKRIYNRLSEKRDIMIAAIEGEMIQPEFTIDEKQEIIDLMNDEIKFIR